MEDNIVSLTWCDEEGFWIDCDLDSIYLAYYVNHSDDLGVDEKTSILLFVNIKKDEELLYRYSRKGLGIFTNSNLPGHTWVRKEYLCDFEYGHGEF